MAMNNNGILILFRMYRLLKGTGTERVRLDPLDIDTYVDGGFYTIKSADAHCC